MEGDMEKILSLIVPSYNMEGFLPKCLGSLVVAPELMVRLEVLVVNDGSKDRTSEIAHEFATRYSNTFRVIDKANGHYGSCINAALKIATGTYIKILDADDTLETPLFEQFLRNFIGHCDAKAGSEVDLIITPYQIVDECGVSQAVVRFPYVDGERMAFPEALPGLSNIAMHAIAYRADLLRKVHYRQTEGICYTDTEWNVLPMEKVSSVIYFDKPIYRYLVGRAGQSVSVRAYIKNVNMLLVVARRLVGECPLRFHDGVKRDFACWQLHRILNLICNICVFVLPVRNASTVADELANLYAHVDQRVIGLMHDVVIMKRVWGGFHYCRAFVERKHLRWGLAMLLRLYARINRNVFSLGGAQ